jgi:hypothetical protein
MRLDIMRCAAILLVLFHHCAVLPSISQMGCVGVDMFFVLSGFLISGLLYTEYQKRGAISFKSFLFGAVLRFTRRFTRFGCVVFGIVMARLIEFPVLRMREKFFPPEQTALAAPPASTTYDAEALISAKNA